MCTQQYRMVVRRPIPCTGGVIAWEYALDLLEEIMTARCIKRITTYRAPGHEFQNKKDTPRLVKNILAMNDVLHPAAVFVRLQFLPQVISWRAANESCQVISPKKTLNRDSIS